MLVAALLAAGGAARAQPDDPQARSRVLYEEGSRAYKAGDYPRAIEKFLAAYDLSRAPAILFNIAQAYRLAGSCDRALEYYRRSLDEEPDASNRDEVEERIDEMQTCADDEARKKAQVTAEPAAQPAASAPAPIAVDLADEQPERPRTRRSLLPLVTVGVGAAAAVTGGVIYLRARARFDEVEATCPCEPGSFSGWETATDASYVLMGAGVVAAGAGLIWWWTQSHRDSPPRVGVVPTARGIGWAASF